MRKEPFTIGDYVHVYNRGNRKMKITYDDADKWRFLKSFRYFNDEYSPENIFRDLSLPRKSNFHKMFMWPPEWPPHDPLVKILAFCLMPNHFHLLLKEIKVGGISKLMAKFGTGITNYTNLKYGEVGRLFQGSYKARTVKEMEYLQYLNIYIQVLNPLELFPAGLEVALKDFDKAFEFVINYQFGSLPDFLEKRNLGIIEKDIFDEMFSDLESYKGFAYDCFLKKDFKKTLGKLTID